MRELVPERSKLARERSTLVPERSMLVLERSMSVREHSTWCELDGSVERAGSRSGPLHSMRFEHMDRIDANDTGRRRSPTTSSKEPNQAVKQQSFSF